MHVPASITSVFFNGYTHTAAAANAILSLPNVDGVVYRFLNGNEVVVFNVTKSGNLLISLRYSSLISFTELTIL